MTFHENTATQLLAQERKLLWLLALLTLVAVAGPNPAQWLHLQASGHAHEYAHGHAFIDARSFLGIPNFMDVASNLPFLVGGVWGLWYLLRMKFTPTPIALRRAAAVFFAGLVLTFAGSSYYHWAPDAFGLMIDRLGMAVAFAGVVGLAVGDRISFRAAQVITPWWCAAAVLAVVVCYATGNLLPWAVVQFGGMALVLWLAFTKPVAGGLQISWLALIAFYALAKLCEAGDAWVFHATNEFISGHSLKHLVASMAAWPVITALKRHNLAS
jgi:hypothetical protein